MNELVPGTDPTPAELACFLKFDKDELDQETEPGIYPHIVSSDFYAQNVLSLSNLS